MKYRGSYSESDRKRSGSKIKIKSLGKRRSLSKTKLNGAVSAKRVERGAKKGYLTDDPGEFGRKRAREEGGHPYRHLIFASSILGSQFKRHLLITLKGLIYATKCLKTPSMSFVKTKMIELPRENVDGKSPLF